MKKTSLILALLIMTFPLSSHAQCTTAPAACGVDQASRWTGSSWVCVDLCNSCSGGGASGEGFHSDGPTPTGCVTAGQRCSDGSYYSGSGNLYINDVDEGKFQWEISREGPGNDDISPDSSDSGEVNHKNRMGSLADFPAFKVCEELVRHGHDDWYLPSRDELNLIFLNGGANLKESEDSGYYWSSTENGTLYAWYQYFRTGEQQNNDKGMNFNVRCVRRDD